MTWLLWRQYRAAAFVTGAIVAIFAVAVLLTGVHMSHVYNDAIQTCTRNGTCDFVGNLFSGYGAIVDIVHLSIVLPVLLGVFLGATLIARETENSTHILLWTQTVRRRSWLVTKIAIALGATLAASAVVTALVTWWSGTPNALYGNRFEGAEFDTQNIVPIAYSLFAVALGIAAGALWRRTLPALATTVLVYIGVRLAVGVYARPHYMKAVSKSFPLDGPESIPSGSWVRQRAIVDPAGHSLGATLRVPSACGGVPDTKGAAISCLNHLGYRNVATYQPPSHYWNFQWIEAGLFVVLAAALVGFAILYTLRRDA